MKIPRSVMVSGKRWRVRVMPLFRRYGLWGKCIHRRHEIQIDCYLPAREKFDTFLHELMHACLPEPAAPRTEEHLIERLDSRLAEALISLGWVK